MAREAIFLLPDGTPCFAPPGELPLDVDGTRVQCHLCGVFYRALGAHLRGRHGWPAERYRETFGLSRGRPLQAPDVSARQEAALRRRMHEDPRIKEGMAAGRALARSGALPRLARPTHEKSVRPLERRRVDVATGSRLGSERACRLRQQREERARGLGHSGLEAYFRARYRREGATVRAVAVELGVGESTVIADMDLLGIPRRPQAERLARGRSALRAKRETQREAVRARARALGFSSLAAYLRDRHHERGWRRADIARELGLPANRSSLARLLAAEAVPGNRRAGARA